jgi:putative transposase
MGLPRSTFYDAPAATVGDVALVAKIVVICDEFETYGYRRVGAELRHHARTACNPSAAQFQLRPE